MSAVMPQSVSPEQLEKELDEVSFDSEDEFDVEIHHISGFKGSGKTTFSLGFAKDNVFGKHCLSYDKKTRRIKENFSNTIKGFPKELLDKIHVAEPIKLLDKLITNTDDMKELEKQLTLAYYKVYLSSINLLGKVRDNGGTGWVVFDETEEMHRSCEHTMRYLEQIGAFQGFKNFNLWKKRNLYLIKLLTSASMIATKGLIFTSYLNIQEIDQEDGTTKKVEMPKWVDAIMKRTDVSWKIYTAKNKSGNKMWNAEVLNSKLDKYEEGKVFDITGRTIGQILG